MSSPTSPTDRHAGNCSTYPLGGIAPLQQDIARHAYLEKKLLHAEMDRQHQAWMLQTKTLTQRAMNAIFAHIASARTKLQSHFQPATAVKSRG